MGSTRFFDCKKEMGGMLMDSYSECGIMEKSVRSLHSLPYFLI